MEGFMIGGWDLPECGGASMLIRGATLPCAGSMIPVNQQSMRIGFPQHMGQYRPGGSPFLSPGCWSCAVDVRRVSDPWIGLYPPRVQRDLDVVPRGNSCSAFAL